MTRLVIYKCIAAGVGETGEPRGKPTNKPLSSVSSAGADKLDHVFNFNCGEASES
jgi:hypothetical protein